MAHAGPSDELKAKIRGLVAKLPKVYPKLEKKNGQRGKPKESGADAKSLRSLIDKLLSAMEDSKNISDFRRIAKKLTQDLDKEKDDAENDSESDAEADPGD